MARNERHVVPNESGGWDVVKPKGGLSMTDEYRVNEVRPWGREDDRPLNERSKGQDILVPTTAEPERLPPEQPQAPVIVEDIAD